jgi:hypothetical protein
VKYLELSGSDAFYWVGNTRELPLDRGSATAIAFLPIGWTVRGSGERMARFVRDVDCHHGARPPEVAGR